MLQWLYPDYYVKSVFELPIEKLKKRGVWCLIFDIDNTLAPFDEKQPPQQMIELFQKLRKEGFRLCIFSNNNKNRVNYFNQHLHAYAVYRSGKPGISKLKKTMKKLGTDKNTTAIIGDQIFTDVFCGRRARVLTILTKPLCDRDQLVTRVKRGLEKIVIRSYLKRRGENGF